MRKFGLTGNRLKLIALVTMTVDHVGLFLLSQYPILRIIGRLAFPIYAYMIAEGCRYTGSMPRYLGLCAGLAAACQLVDFLVTGSLYQCILVTFSLSMILTWLLRRATERNTALAWLTAAAAVAAVFFLTEVLPGLLTGTDYAVDYGFWGVLLPVGIYFGKSKAMKLCFTGLLLLLMSGELGSIQMFSLLSLPLLALYNGQRGRRKMKYLFYIYYPAHLAVLHLLAIAGR